MWMRWKLKSFSVFLLFRKHSRMKKVFSLQLDSEESESESESESEFCERKFIYWRNWYSKTWKKEQNLIGMCARIVQNWKIDSRAAIWTYFQRQNNRKKIICCTLFIFSCMILCVLLVWIFLFFISPHSTYNDFYIIINDLRVRSLFLTYYFICETFFFKSMKIYWLKVIFACLTITVLFFFLMTFYVFLYKCHFVRCWMLRLKTEKNTTKILLWTIIGHRKPMMSAQLPYTLIL